MSSNYDNNGQYTRHSILRYEKIFGEGFVSSGGVKITQSFCDRLDLPKGAKVLDIGSGLGGAAFMLADQCGAEVHGVDLAGEMIAIAQERAEKQAYPVTFALGDIRELSFEEGTFDLIWSRDALLHIPEKRELFEKVLTWLKPGGEVMFSDYSQAPNPKTDGFKEYVKTSGYHLLDPETYGGILREVGFVNVLVEDWTPSFIEVLRDEKQSLVDKKEIFLKDFTEEDLDYLGKRWEQKIQYCLDGDMRVGLWQAFKAK